MDSGEPYTQTDPLISQWYQLVGFPDDDVLESIHHESVHTHLSISLSLGLSIHLSTCVYNYIYTYIYIIILYDININVHHIPPGFGWKWGALNLIVDHHLIIFHDFYH